MATKQSERIGDTRWLPYSLADRARIQESGALDYREPVPRPPNPTGFHIEDLKGNPILSSDIIVPRTDPRGNVSARYFESWKKAKDSRIGIASNTYSIKGFGPVACLSDLERRVLSYLEMCPFVVEIRSQYPEWDRIKVGKRRAANTGIPKSGVMTIDFVVTYQIPGSRELRYHAISCKPYDQIFEDEVVGRHQREIALLSIWNCTHQIMTEHSITDIQDRNNQRFMQLMLHTENVYSCAENAMKLANRLNKVSIQGDYDFVLAVIGDEYGWDLNTSYKYFGVAIFLGYLKYDHSKEFLPESEVLDLTDERRQLLPRLQYSTLPTSAYATA
ncbi:hypothetical protein C798_25230 [Herbaspirillum rubrisubalbicans Os34]|uniref:Uncharacterized protein n=1 Tax=Herbaspirillum rubrisubalbicans Os34 TaxID=1235827 RepID=A0A6M3ZXW8_9BURK|nr:TnsA endonuclease N-terminal domain-containing protein [Herbaspirillum rubrisubalbicans]QJQ03417.1 hypothetical protein C798_25230 [Herbaspirillum rubrisubalbicans Os34]